MRADQFTTNHKKNLSKALKGNKNGLGKNLKNKNALGKVSAENNGNWKGGTSNRIALREKLAGRKRSQRCEVCYQPCLSCFDHDHETNAFRGWLCRRCNLVLGMVKDNPILLRNLAMYLDNNNIEARPERILNALLSRDYGNQKTS